jgi:hypothetical protein
VLSDDLNMIIWPARQSFLGILTDVGYGSTMWVRRLK